VLPDRVKRPLDGLVAWLTPLGLGISLVGLVLICVPDFFSPTPGLTPETKPTAAGDTQ
jgi:hypothetical protein